METAIVAESARWGDMHRSTPLTKAQWEAESQSVIDTFLTGRTAVFVNQLRSAGLYPTTNAPLFSQHGGEIPASGFNLGMSTTSGVIYYTLDGQDPRAANGAPAGSTYTGPFTIAPGMTVKARTLSGGVWSALNEASYSQLILPGDYDGNYVVNQNDYLVWKNAYGSTSSPADGNGDGVVNAADYTIWRDNVGLSLVTWQAMSAGVTSGALSDSRTDVGLGAVELARAADGSHALDETLLPTDTALLAWDDAGLTPARAAYRPALVNAYAQSKQLLLLSDALLHGPTRINLVSEHPGLAELEADAESSFDAALADLYATSGDDRLAQEFGEEARSPSI